MGIFEKHLNVSHVLDTRTAVSKRAVFGNSVSGILEEAGALGWVRRLPSFMKESKILLGKMVCSSFKRDLSVYSA
jgi:hypothetical protein